MNLKAIVTLFFVIIVAKCEYMRDWGARKVNAISELAMIPDTEFTHANFDPPIHVRGDGAAFLSIAIVDSDAWINLALNSFVSLARFQSINGVTVVTLDDNGQIEMVFKKLGIYAYNANPTIAKFPEDFRKDKALPNWSWGAVIFLRFNLWIEAFRRGVGMCNLDVDVTYNRDFLFGANSRHESHVVHDADIAAGNDVAEYLDIVMQGRQVPMKPLMKTNECN